MVTADSTQRGSRLIWAFYLAAAIALVGGALPFVFGGASSRVAGVILPFGVATAGLVACALLHNQSRLVVAIVYFLAGLAIVYGLISMFSLPVRLAALGSCPVAPNPCTTGLPRALTDGENTGIGTAAAFGIAALFVGFFGLVTLYRRTAPPPYVPPVRTIPPMPPPPPMGDRPDNRPVEAVKTAGRPDDLPAEELEELPAPEELPELPAHESSTSSS